MKTAFITPKSSLTDYQQFVKTLYGANNERHFSVDEMLTNISRFAMRGLKGIRKENKEKIRLNILVSMSWTMSLMNQLNINVEEEIWKRFPYVCSYCGECPCACRVKKVQKRLKIKRDDSKRPKTIAEVQEMLRAIYPPGKRTLEQAGIHLAEEVGELSEAVLQFRGHHSAEDLDNVRLEVADLMTNFFAVLNSADIDYAKEIIKEFGNGCHACKRVPCVCEYDFILNFKS